MAARDEPITAWYPNQPTAQQAVRHLESAGIPADAISVIGLRYRSSAVLQGRHRPGGSGRSGWLGKGVWIGALCGLLAGLGLFFVPGLLPAGRAIGLIVTAIIGASVGSFISSILTLSAAAKENAVYVTRLRAGEFLVSVHGSPETMRAARTILVPEPRDDECVPEAPLTR